MAWTCPETRASQYGEGNRDVAASGHRFFEPKQPPLIARRRGIEVSRARGWSDPTMPGSSPQLFAAVRPVRKGCGEYAGRFEGGDKCGSRLCVGAPASLWLSPRLKAGAHIEMPSDPTTDAGRENPGWAPAQGRGDMRWFVEQCAREGAKCTSSTSWPIESAARSTLA